MATNLPKQVINLTKQTTKRNSALMKDVAFKSFMKYKGITAMVLKYIVPELNGMTELEIAKSIKDIQMRSVPQNNMDIITDKIDLLPSEDSEVGEKNIRYDITFLLSVSQKNIQVDLTIGLEMQQTTSSTALQYELVSRAVYYAAALLRNTITADNKDYSQIHKVYSIWFCKNDILNQSERTGTLDKEFVHRYKMLRTYNPPAEGSKGEWKYDARADLMEVVMIELNRISKDAPHDSLGNTLNSLFYETDTIIPMVNKTYGVNISNTVIEQEVKDMYEKQDFINEGKELGIEEGQLLAAQTLLSKQIAKGKQFTEERAIQFLADNLDLSPELSKLAYQNVTQRVN